MRRLLKIAAVLVLGLALLLGLTPQAQAGRLLTSGFELNSTTLGVEFDGIEPTTQNAAIVTSPVRTGTYAFQASASSSTKYGCAGWTIPTMAAGRTYYARAYAYFSTWPTSGKISGVMAWGEGFGGGFWSGLQVDSSGNLGLYNQTGALIGSTTALSLNTSYRLEMSYSYTSKALAAQVNGTQFASGTDAASSGISSFYVFAGGNINATTGDTASVIVFDDIAVNDDQGSYQNTWAGAGNVIMLQPSATGDANAWLNTSGGAGATTNWNLVNEHPPDGATSFIESKTTSQQDLFKCPASGIPSTATINLVAVNCWFAGSATSSESAFELQIEKAASGTKTSSAAITPNSTTYQRNANATPRTSPITAYQNPDSAAWTQALIDTMQIGAICSTGSTNYDRVSTLWAYVDYTPATAVTGTGSPASAAMTAAGSGSYAGYSFSGTGVPSLHAMTAAGSGSYAGKSFTGTAAPHVAAMAAAASGTFAGYSFSGTGGPLTAGMTASGSGSYAGFGFTGTATPEAAAMTAAGVGSYAGFSFTGTSGPVVAQMACVASGTFTAFIPKGGIGWWQ